MVLILKGLLSTKECCLEYGEMAQLMRWSRGLIADFLPRPVPTALKSMMQIYMVVAIIHTSSCLMSLMSLDVA